MTTAHRPTWNPAQGGEDQGTFRLHAPSARTSGKDAPAHTVMKSRLDAEQIHQPPEELREALQIRERVAKRKRVGEDGLNLGRLPLELANLPGGELDADVILDSEDEGDGTRKRTKKLKVDRWSNPTQVVGTASEEGGRDAHKSLQQDGLRKSDEEEDSASSEDDDDELMLELARIRREREEERLDKAKEAAEVEATRNKQNVMQNNPLLDLETEGRGSSRHVAAERPVFGVRQRWDDDVVFRNQASGEKKLTQRFVNDTLRNDFHRRFLRRYVR